MPEGTRSRQLEPRREKRQHSLLLADEMSHLDSSTLFTFSNKVVSKPCNTQLKRQLCS